MHWPQDDGHGVPSEAPSTWFLLNNPDHRGNLGLLGFRLAYSIFRSCRFWLFATFNLLEAARTDFAACWWGQFEAFEPYLLQQWKQPDWAWIGSSLTADFAKVQKSTGLLHDGYPCLRAASGTHIGLWLFCFRWQSKPQKIALQTCTSKQAWWSEGINVCGHQLSKHGAQLVGMRCIVVHFAISSSKLLC